MDANAYATVVHQWLGVRQALQAVGANVAKGDGLGSRGGLSIARYAISSFDPDSSTVPSIPSHSC